MLWRAKEIIVTYCGLLWPSVTYCDLQSSPHQPVRCAVVVTSRSPCTWYLSWTRRKRKCGQIRQNSHSQQPFIFIIETDLSLQFLSATGGPHRGLFIGNLSCDLTALLSTLLMPICTVSHLFFWVPHLYRTWITPALSPTPLRLCARRSGPYWANIFIHYVPSSMYWIHPTSDWQLQHPVQRAAGCHDWEMKVRNRFAITIVSAATWRNNAT